MGIDVVVLDSNNQSVGSQVFKDEGLESSNLRHFGITGWIALFNSLIGEDDLVDTFAYEMKSASPEMIEEWCVYLEQTFSVCDLTSDQQRIKAYINFVRNNDYSLVFW